MNNREKIIRILEIIHDSMGSHLPYCIDFELTQEDKDADTPEFHRKCVEEYVVAETLLIELLLDDNFNIPCRKGDNY